MIKNVTVLISFFVTCINFVEAAEVVVKHCRGTSQYSECTANVMNLPRINRNEPIEIKVVPYQDYLKNKQEQDYGCIGTVCSHMEALPNINENKNKKMNSIIKRNLNLRPYERKWDYTIDE